MKSIYSIALAAIMALLQAAPIPGAVNQTWTGEISSNNCGAAYMPGMSAQDFTRECVDRGSSYVLMVSHESAYRFANQADRALRIHAGERVTVTGELEGDVITVSSIEVAK